MVNKSKLISLLTQKGYNQTTFALALGMHQNTFYSKISGRDSFTLEQVDKICLALKITDPLEKCEIFLFGASQYCDTINHKGISKASTAC